MAFTRSNILAGWSRSGLEPANMDKRLTNPQVVSFTCVMPQLECSPHPEGVYSTLSKLREY